MTTPWDQTTLEKPRPDVKPLEDRAGIDSLEKLQHERRQLIKRFAELSAQFRGGQNASAETKRKEHRALTATKVADGIYEKWTREASDEQKKKGYSHPAEAFLERMARAHPDHIAFCKKLETEFVEYVMIENQITEIKEKIESRKEELRAYTGELYLQGGN